MTAWISCTATYSAIPMPSDGVMSAITNRRTGRLSSFGSEPVHLALHKRGVQERVSRRLVAALLANHPPALRCRQRHGGAEHHLLFGDQSRGPRRYLGDRRGVIL